MNWEVLEVQVAGLLSVSSVPLVLETAVAWGIFSLNVIQRNSSDNIVMIYCNNILCDADFNEIVIFVSGPCLANHSIVL